MAASKKVNKSKLSSELDKMKPKAIQGVFDQLKKSLQDEIQADISLTVAQDFTCFNKCIVLSMAPELSSIDDINKVVVQDEIIDSLSKEKLASIYKLNYSIYSGQIGEILINLNKLLDDGLYSDIVVNCNDDKIYNCHKCILAAHSQYFEMMFNNSWQESKESCVKLNNVSSEVFKVILNFMYSAKIDIPTDVDVVSLIFAQDLLNVKGFQDVLNLHLKAHLCHFYHSPCESCIETLTNFYHVVISSGILGYDDMAKSCIKWFIRYFSKIIGNRSILKVPKVIREVIVTKVKESTSSINVLSTLKECAKLASLPNVKWADEAAKLIKEIESFCMKFICDNFSDVIDQPGFKMCVLEDKNLHMSKLLLEIVVKAIEINIDIQNCIMIYSNISSLNNEVNVQFNLNEEKDLDHSKTFVTKVLHLSQLSIKKNLFKLHRSQDWKNLPDQLKDEFKKKSGFISQ